MFSALPTQCLTPHTLNPLGNCALPLFPGLAVLPIHCLSLCCLSLFIAVLPAPAALGLFLIKVVQPTWANLDTALFPFSLSSCRFPLFFA